MAEALERARACFVRRDWDDAFRAFAAADRDAPLDAENLEQFALSAALTARDAENLAALERAHQAWLQRGEPVRAAIAGFWAALRLGALGEQARASGWTARCEELLAGRDCEECGYVLVLAVFRALRTGDLDGTAHLSERVLDIGARFGNRDLTAFAQQFLGQVEARRGEVEQGLRRLDLAMVAATAGELHPIVTGLVYCNVIACCQALYAVDRSREWTAALSSWCEAQPQLVPFSGRCLVHRAEVLTLGGSWPSALDEARRAAAVSERDRGAHGQAHYQRAEVHRLRGERAAAEEGYRAASGLGTEPQPGLALLRLAEGKGDAARASLARLLEGAGQALVRARHLPAWVEVTARLGDLEAAEQGCAELESIAERYGTDQLRALAWTARGDVLATRRAWREALEPLRSAFTAWQALDAPYHAARIRVLLGRAFGALGDADGEALERDAARASFRALGALPDLEALEPVRPSHGLTPREVEVLRLVARGDTNKEIARVLGVSLKTVDRHVSNLFAKLGLSTRAAATAWAYTHGVAN